MDPAHERDPIRCEPGLGAHDGPIADLLRLSGALMLYNAQVRSAMRFGASDFEALLSLWASGPCNMSNLARRIDLSRAAVSTLAERLEARGMLARLPDDVDRRITRVEPTAAFDRQFDEVTRNLQDALEQVANQTAAWRTFRSVATDLCTILLAEAARLNAFVDEQRVDEQIAEHRATTE